MIFNFVPLSEDESSYFGRKVSDTHRSGIQKLSDESYEELWPRIVPQGLTEAKQLPREHWSHNCQAIGPSFPRYISGEDTATGDKRLKQWRTDLDHFLERAVEFGPNDEVFIADYGGIYVMKWEIFFLNPEAFRPWHDASLVIKKNSLQFVRLVEDYHWVIRGQRPAISGFDSKSFCSSNKS